MVKGYTEIFDLDYGDIFSPMAYVRLFLSMPAICHLPFDQLHIKNAFLHDGLEEEACIEQPPGGLLLIGSLLD